MPELPDVEHFRRYLKRYVKGRQVRTVEVNDPDVLKNTRPQSLGRALKGRRFTEPERHGKWLLARTGSPTLLLHFGMTGTLDWTGDPDGRHEHDRVVFHLSGGDLRYRIQRKFGGIWLAKSQDDEGEIMGPLGPDADDLGRHDVEDLLAGRRGAVKSTLMNQELVAGIGNELSDEILWTARIHPARRLTDFSPKDRDDLYEAMRDVLGRSKRRGCIPREAGWFNSVRRRDGAPCPRCGAPVEKGTVGGRTAYWCPSCQAT